MIHINFTIEPKELAVRAISFAFHNVKQNKMRVHNKEYLLQYRRKLRNRETNAETIFWQHVRNGKLNGLKFKRQHSIGNYIVDFYCASGMLVIELDGSAHNSKEQKEKDRLRDENLREINFKILRFKNREIITNIDTVKQQILDTLTIFPSKQIE